MNTATIGIDVSKYHLDIRHPPDGAHRRFSNDRVDTAILADMPELGSVENQQVAITAIMRKLLVLANALLRDRRTWKPDMA